MALVFQNFCIQSRSLHVASSCFQIRKRFPIRAKSIKDTAEKLGFMKATDMYPEYPLDEPPKLWMIVQTGTLKERPYWEKEAMKEMGLYRVGDVCVQVNGARVNDVLWSVKHLIKIQPVRFPQGYPEKSDVGFTQLKRNGEFMIYKKLESPPMADADVVPRPAEEDWKVVDGYRMCKSCKHRRCLKFGMCQKVWLQRGNNNIEHLGPRMFNYVDNPLKKLKQNSPEE